MFRLDADVSPCPFFEAGRMRKPDKKHPAGCVGVHTQLLVAPKS